MLIFNAILDFVFHQRRRQQAQVLQQAVALDLAKREAASQEIIDSVRERIVDTYKQGELKSQSRKHMFDLWRSEFQTEKDRLLIFLNEHLPTSVGSVVTNQNLQDILADFEFTTLFSLRAISDDKNYHAIETAEGKYDVSFVAEPNWCLCSSEEDTKTIMKELGFRSGLFKPDNKSPAQKGFKRV